MNKIVFITCCICCNPWLHAQKTMDLQACRQMALENNKSLKIAEENVRTAKSLSKAAFAQFLPDISAYGNYRHNQMEEAIVLEDADLKESSGASPSVSIEEAWRKRPEIRMLTQADYGVYLSNVLLPGVLQLLIILFTIYAIGVEMKQNSTREWLSTGGESMHAALTGKLWPHTLLFTLLGWMGVFLLLPFLVYSRLAKTIARYGHDETKNSMYNEQLQ